MAIPEEGGSWRGVGLGDVDSRFNNRGGLAAVLVRDNRGAATNISPWTSGSPATRGWSPFAEDGNPRTDLFACIRVDGEWITNPEPNEGFWLVGAMTEDGGPERAPNISEDNQMILQSNFPFDSDLTEEGIVINFTGVETLKPLMKRLRMNLPLSDRSGNPIVEDPGTEHFSIGKPLDVESVERQLVLVFAKRKGGKYVFNAEGYSLCKLTNIGSFRRSKTDPDAGELGFTVLPDPFLVIKDPGDPTSNELIPALYAEWTDGDGWTAIGGAPVFAGAAPAPTLGGTGAATIVFDEAIGGGDPFDYTAEYKQGAGEWTEATIASVTPDTPTAGKITVAVTGVPAGATIFRVTATGTNGQTTVSASTSSVTIT
jgi:hypothetical protein